MKTSTKFVAVPLMALTLLAGGLGFQVNQSQAALSARSPILDPASGFPLWYEDVAGGTKLLLCRSANNLTDPNCIADDVINPANPQEVAAGFGAEAFYFYAENIIPLSSGGQALLVLGLEAGYASPEPQNLAQTVFNRIRVRIDAPVAGDYVVTHPFGTKTYTVVTPGTVSINDTIDIPGLVAQNFNDALTDGFSPLVFGPFLTAVSPAAPAGYIGQAGIEQTVTGSPLGNNFFQIIGPAGSNIGGVGIDSVTDSTFVLSGKLFAPTVKEVTPVATITTNPASYTFSANDAGTIAVGGSCTRLAGETANAIAGNNTITLDAALGAHADCTVTITNAALNASNVLNVKPFTVSQFLPDTIAIQRGNDFFLKNTNAAGAADVSFTFGINGDIPISGDWDNDGVKTPGLKRGNTFFLRNSNSTGVADITFTFGAANDKPVVGDWDGNGTETVGVFRDNDFFLRNTNTSGEADITFRYGIAGDQPIVGDWDGDGVDTFGVFRDNQFFLRNANTSGVADFDFLFGIKGDIPVSGDWDGNGTDTFGVMRGNRIFLRNSNTSGVADFDFIFGQNGDLPISGVWDLQP